MSINRRIVVLVLLMALGGAYSPLLGDLLPESSVDRLDMQKFWETRLPLAGATISRVSLLDDNLYILSSSNRIYAVHGATGVLRWSRDVAEPNVTVRGPSHSAEYVFFTTSAGVRVLNRATGEPGGEPRTLSGVIFDVAHDTAEINIGRLHGVRLGNSLKVYHAGPRGDIVGDQFAELRITSIQARTSKGHMVRTKANEEARSGDVATSNIVLPLPKVDLPFAASCAAVADENWLYVGAANQRFYSLNILTGFERWQISTPKTVTATPVLYRDDLYFTSNAGTVVSCTKRDRVKNWSYQTEGPIFSSPVVTEKSVYVSSSDRSLYCFDRLTGRRQWRERFDDPLDQTPAYSAGRIYQLAPPHGLFVLDAETGKRLWHRDAGGQFLTQLKDQAYLWNGQNNVGGWLVVVNAATGEEKRVVDAGMAGSAAADRDSQSIWLVAGDGTIECLRSKDAPYLKPAALASVLQNDKTARWVYSGEPKAKAEAAPAATPALPERSAKMQWLFENWFMSHSKYRPVGGHGLVPMGGKAEEPKKTEKAPKEKSVKEKKKAEKEDAEAGEDDEGADKGDEDAGEGDEGGDSDSGDDDSGDDEGGDDEGGG